LGYDLDGRRLWAVAKTFINLGSYSKRSDSAWELALQEPLEFDYTKIVVNAAVE
jgi:hypothetical protein